MYIPPAFRDDIESIREFDGEDEAAELVNMLCVFDKLFN